MPFLVFRVSAFLDEIRAAAHTMRLARSGLAGLGSHRVHTAPPCSCPAWWCWLWIRGQSFLEGGKGGKLHRSDYEGADYSLPRTRSSRPALRDGDLLPAV